LAVLKAGIPTLPGVEPPKLRDILAVEATKPLRGGDRDLADDSLWGERRLQIELF